MAGISKNMIHSVKFSKTKLYQYLPNLKQILKQIKYLLGRFDIKNVYINKEHILYTEKRNEKCAEIVLNISLEHFPQFMNKIGFRYCSDKLTKSSVILSYKNMSNKVSEQYNKIISRIKQLSNYTKGKKRGVKTYIQQAFDELCNNEIVFNKDTIYPKYQTVIHQLQQEELYPNTIYKHKFQNKSFPKPSEYIKQIGMEQLLEHKYIDNNTFNLKVVGKRKIGLKKVYDLSVNNVHSFVANGLVVHNCMEVFYDEDFESKLDKNPHLFAFRNGVYDLKQHIFRAGRPEDYLSKKAPIDYKEYNIDDEEIQEVLDYLEKIFPDKTLRQYFLDTSSEVFIGKNLF